MRTAAPVDIYVTADDYGITLGANSAIEDLADAGRVSAVSVMAHRDAELGSLRRLVDTGVTIGLHLCFTVERPFIGALAGSGGRLPADHRRLFAAILAKPRILLGLRAEAEAQAARLAGEGVPIAFVNGHEHVHLFPALWPLVAALSRRIGARAVRCALGQSVEASAAGALAASARVSWALSPLPGVTVLSPLGTGLAGQLTLEVTDTLLSRPFTAGARRVRELCYHPELDETGRRAEYELLASGAVERLLERRGLRLARGLAH